MILDKWLGAESIQYFKEVNLKRLIRQHVEGSDEIDYIEGIGAINFLSLDDISVNKEGELVDPHSILPIEFSNKKPVFPAFRNTPDDPFLSLVHKSGKKWIVLTDSKENPKLVMDADGFLRSALLDVGVTDPLDFCHKPFVVKNPHIPLGDILEKIPDEMDGENGITLERDLVLVWGETRRIITGSDILERLLKGIHQKVL